nr:hypothetical protein [Thermoanaerobacterium thermosaccharolyticum]
MDKIDNKELIRGDRRYNPLYGIYEIIDIKSNPCEKRRRMGRNRKSISTKRYTSILKDIRIIESGKLYSMIEMSFSLEGAREYTVNLKVYHDLHKITVIIRVHKESRWKPENLYISLPFTTGEQEELYIDKTGCIIRPGIDQLLGKQ